MHLHLSWRHFKRLRRSRLSSKIRSCSLASLCDLSSVPVSKIMTPDWWVKCSIIEDTPRLSFPFNLFLSNAPIFLCFTSRQAVRPSDYLVVYICLTDRTQRAGVTWAHLQTFVHKELDREIAARRLQSRSVLPNRVRGGRGEINSSGEGERGRKAGLWHDGNNR